MSNELKTKEQILEGENAEAKILHILSIYPIISPTMLQSGLGPYTKPGIWRPVLAKLIKEGRVIETTEGLQTPSDRYNSYTKLSLPHVHVTIGKQIVR